MPCKHGVTWETLAAAGESVALVTEASPRGSGEGDSVAVTCGCTDIFAWEVGQRRGSGPGPTVHHFCCPGTHCPLPSSYLLLCKNSPVLSALVKGPSAPFKYRNI